MLHVVLEDCTFLAHGICTPNKSTIVFLAKFFGSFDD